MFFFRKKCDKKNGTANWNGKERRRFVRRNIPCKIFLCISDNKIVTAYAEDICEEGLQAVLDESFPVNTPVRIELYLEDEPIICEGRIAWVREEISRKDGPKKYRTGIDIKDRHIF